MKPLVERALAMPSTSELMRLWPHGKVSLRGGGLMLPHITEAYVNINLKEEVETKV